MISFRGAAIAVLAVAAPGLALAQSRPEPPDPGYRTGLPQVNAAPTPENPQAGGLRTAQAFRAWYARARRPSMMIFWNREQTDETTTRFAEVTARGEAAGGAAAAGVSRNGRAEWVEAYQARTGVTVSGQVATTGGKFAPMDTLLSSQLEGAFQSAWLDSGVKLVDRTAIIRKLSVTAKRDDRADVQFIESAAMAQGARYLIEVLPLARAASPTGLTFMVKVKHLPTSTMVAQFNTDAEPASGPERIVAVPGGFEKRHDSRTTPANIGAELAYQTMSRFR